ncbi:MAG: YdeI/OmpD-associated family protein [Mucilaginibacter sp.]|nr:YdeI/OmpD-associated family protein [Mucilaginibacter sp.]
MTPLAKKLQIKPGKNWLLFNAPDTYLSSLEPLPHGVTIAFEPHGNFDGIQLFVKGSAELALSLKIIAPALKPETILWIVYPKKSSGIPSDWEMMSSWDECKKYGLRPVASVAINEIWTGLRFRHESQVKVSDGGKDNIRQNEYSAYIDVDNKQVKLTPQIAEVLQQTPAALEFYQQLSYSNKKEYVLWILTAKQEKTRDERITRLVEKLLAGKKNPSEK